MLSIEQMIVGQLYNIQTQTGALLGYELIANDFNTINFYKQGETIAQFQKSNNGKTYTVSPA